MSNRILTDGIHADIHAEPLEDDVDDKISGAPGASLCSAASREAAATIFVPPMRQRQRAAESRYPGRPIRTRGVNSGPGPT